MLSLVQSDEFSPAPDPFNMAAYVLGHADRLADKVALEIVGNSCESLTYGALKAAVLGTATGLLDAGLSPGDRVLLQLGNTADFPIAYLAAIAVGIIPVPLSDQLTGPELRVIHDMIKPAMTLQGAGMAKVQGPLLTKDALMAFRSATPALFNVGDPNRPAYIVFTSGTSGKPRAVVHAHRAVWARQMMWDGWYGLREDDRLMHAGAFNWTYTLGTGLMDPWSVGATAIIPAQGTDAAALGSLMGAHKATLFAAAPGVYRRLLRADIPPLPHLRHGLSAGEKMSPHDHATWEQKTGTVVYEAFGMSECSTFISGSPQMPAPKHAAGFVQPGRTLALLGTDGPVLRGEIGHIAIHKDDPGLMLGYLDQSKETAARYQGDWFITGDLAKMDDVGAITYAGRADDMMNAGGYRVSPIEVEDALTAHPAVTEAAACAVQIRADVWVIAGFYVATDVIDQEDLRNFLAKRLAPYKIPRLFIAYDALPRGANNKLLRRRLRTEWETAYGQA